MASRVVQRTNIFLIQDLSPAYSDAEELQQYVHFGFAS